MNTYTYIYEQDPSIAVQFYTFSFPKCCGASVLTQMKVCEVLEDEYSEVHYSALSKEKFNERVPDRQPFYDGLKKYLEYKLSKGRRYFATAALPLAVVNKGYAYYDAIDTNAPAITMHTLLRKTGWEQQPSWVNSLGGNTLSSFYKDIPKENSNTVTTTEEEEL